ncbi:MAG: Rap1a/Tai family immunity protein [Motiliproteus sp.]
MIRIIRILLIVITASSSIEAMADGNYLLQRCKHAVKPAANLSMSTQRAAISYCFGLLQGVREVNRLYEGKNASEAYFCLGSQRLSHSETAKLVVDYLQQNPQRLHQNESILTVQALRQAYPCQQ